MGPERESDSLRRNMSASIGGLCQMWGIGCLLAPQWAYGIHCALLWDKAIWVVRQPTFSCRNCGILEIYHLQLRVQQRTGEHRVQGDRGRRSNLKVVCVWVRFNGKPVDGWTQVSTYTIHKVLCRPTCNKSMLPRFKKSSITWGKKTEVPIIMSMNY